MRVKPSESNPSTPQHAPSASVTVKQDSRGALHRRDPLLELALDSVERADERLLVDNDVVHVRFGPADAGRDGHGVGFDDDPEWRVLLASWVEFRGWWK